MNTYIAWINGFRVPHGTVEITSRGRLSQIVATDAVIKREVLGDKRLNSVVIDHYMGGRLSASYEWVRTDSFKDKPEIATIKVPLKATESDPSP